MKVDYPIVCLRLKSRLFAELIKEYILDSCNGNCVFVENPFDPQVRNRRVMVVAELADFLGGEPFEGNGIDPGQTLFHVIVNLQKADEVQLMQSSRLQQIRGVFYADDGPDQFRKGFAAIINNEIWVSREVLMRWMSSAGQQNMARAAGLLSSREMAVVRLVVAGMSNKEISDELFISTNTVKAHLYNIYKKIDVSNRLQAAIWASENLGEQLMNNRIGA